jgi:CheY-like chemotaxis protein
MERADEAGTSATASAARVLIADDDDAIRALFVALLKLADTVGDVVAAADGAAALAVAEASPLAVAILDLHMPRLDGIAAAARIAAVQPPVAIALHSSDLEALERRASGLGIPLFDKADFDGLVAWVAAELERRRDLLALPGGTASSARDRRCRHCGYGVACASPPRRCPMCGRATE